MYNCYKYLWKEELENKSKRSVNERLNFALEDKNKMTRKEKEDSDKEIEKKLDHELNFSSEYSNEEIDGPNVSDIGI